MTKNQNATDPISTEREALAVAEARLAEAEATRRDLAGKYRAAAANFNALQQRTDDGDATAALELGSARTEANALRTQVESLDAARRALKANVKDAKRALVLAEVVAGIGGYLSEEQGPALVEEALVPIIEKLAEVYAVLEQADRMNQSAITELKGPATGYAGQAGAPVQFIGSDRNPEGFQHGARRFNTRNAHALKWAIEDRLMGRIETKAKDLQPAEVKEWVQAYAEERAEKNAEANKIARQTVARDISSMGARPNAKRVVKKKKADD